jgi:hypothetical protein
MYAIFREQHSGVICMLSQTTPFVCMPVYMYAYTYIYIYIYIYVCVRVVECECIPQVQGVSERLDAHAYIHTDHTYIQTYLMRMHTYIQTIHTYIHT